MAEYWKSTPKYWCKHCQIYIRDTAFEKTQHEATGKHQGNLKRFLRDIHRNKEREERDNQRTKNEVERLRNLVSGKPAAAGAGESSRSRPAIAAQSTASASASKQATSEERKRQIAQLAEMGVAVPEEYRKEMALAGEWETISERRIEPETSNRDEKESTTRKLNIGVRKRKLESQEENDDEEAQMIAKPAHKGWGKATRDYPGAAGDEDDDLDALLMRTTTTTTTTTTKKAEIQDSESKSPPLKEEDNSKSAVAKTPLKDPDDFDHSKVLKEGEGLDTEEPPSIGNAPVVFKKRKNKSVKQ